MFQLPRSLPRALCALSLACAMSISPVLAHQTQASSSQDASSVQSAPAQSTGNLDVTQTSHYLRYAPLLLERGYSQQELEVLFTALPSYRIPVLVRQVYCSKAVEFTQQSHFRSTLLERYLKYAQAYPEYSAADVVTRVNIGLDRKWYSSVRQICHPEAIDVLVYKYNALSPTYKPELVAMSSWYANRNAYLHPEAYEWFVKMVNDARADGLKLYCVSAYRSYSYQSSLYQRYVNQDGSDLADTYSARPGYSEHQTGLAVDINTASTSAHFEDTAQYRWLVENSWKYGFILRYPQGKEDITGFQFEPWHYRYVGQELAKALYESGLTYEEYLAGAPAQTPEQPASAQQLSS